MGSVQATCNARVESGDLQSVRGCAGPAGAYLERNKRGN